MNSVCVFPVYMPLCAHLQVKSVPTCVQALLQFVLLSLLPVCPHTGIGPSDLGPEEASPVGLGGSF